MFVNVISERLRHHQTFAYIARIIQCVISVTDNKEHLAGAAADNGLQLKRANSNQRIHFFQRKMPEKCGVVDCAIPNDMEKNETPRSSRFDGLVKHTIQSPVEKGTSNRHVKSTC
jgi:hypothetical protein